MNLAEKFKAGAAIYLPQKFKSDECKNYKETFQQKWLCFSAGDGL
jgi:hypothetical protein